MSGFDTAVERAWWATWGEIARAAGLDAPDRIARYLDEIDRLRSEAEILQTNVRRARGDVAVLREWHQIDLEEIERLRDEVRRLKGEGQNFPQGYPPTTRMISEGEEP